MNTTMSFWDCNCDEKFIHRKAEKECAVCGATPDTSPDSRPVEVLQHAEQLQLTRLEIEDLKVTITQAMQWG